MTTSPESLVERWQRARASVDTLKREIGRKRRALHDAAAHLRRVEGEARTLGVALVVAPDEEAGRYGSSHSSAAGPGRGSGDAGGSECRR